MVDHIFMDFPIPLQTLWTPWTCVILWCSNIIPKITCYFLYATFNPFLMYIRGYWPQTHVHLEFSLMCVGTTWLLAFHIPRDRSDLTLHYPFGVLYKEPLGYIEGEELKRKETIVHCCLSLLILESASLCPFGVLCVLPKISFALWDCYREMEDWGGGGLGFFGSQMCWQRLSVL